MSIFESMRRRTRAPARKRSVDDSVSAWFAVLGDSVFPSGYRSLGDCPEIQAGLVRIAQIISIMPIRLMQNTEKCDVRIHNGLSRVVDIEPSPVMPRQIWEQKIVYDMLLHGNAFVLPITKEGLIQELRPLPHSSVRMTDEKYDYTLAVDGRPVPRDSVLNFIFNPDPDKPWRGRGLSVSLEAVAASLAQSRATANSIKENPMPSIIVKVNGLSEELKTEEGRDKFERRFLKRKSTGQPWIVPGEAIDVKDLKPMTINDLAISDQISMDRKLAAAILGLPAFVLGEGDFNRDAWNLAVSTVCPPITQAIEQVLTAGLLRDPSLHFSVSFFKLMSYDLDQLKDYIYGGFDRGVFSGNEARAAVGYEPVEGLDEFKALENYIPVDQAGNQKKLKGESE